MSTKTMKTKRESLWEAHVKCHEKYWKIFPELSILIERFRMEVNGSRVLMLQVL